MGFQNRYDFGLHGDQHNTGRAATPTFFPRRYNGLNRGVATVKALIFSLVYAIAILGILVLGTMIYVVLAVRDSQIPPWTPGGRGDALWVYRQRPCSSEA